MKNILVAIAFTVMGQFAFANGASTPVSDGRGGMKCAAYDTGHEEHGNHNSCGECLSKHQDCKMKCYDYTYSCTVEGTVRTYDSAGKVIEAKRSFTAEASTERRARDYAQEDCRRGDASYCGYATCQERPSLRDSYSCK